MPELRALPGPATPRPACKRCGLPMDDAALVSDQEETGLCTTCGIASRRLEHFVPDLGPADPGALEYINAVWGRIPDAAEFRRLGQPAANLKQLIRAEADAIRKQARFREAIVAAVERATGIARGVEVGHG